MDASSFVKRVGKLPSLPSLYYELATAIDNPNYSIEAIGGVVRKDQSMTSRLLKLANSAFYSFPYQVETIEEALQLIGLREMRDLALATCVIGAFKNLPTGLVNVVDFWRHSIACGVASGILAERRRDSAPERFFVGGLLHDIGRLILYVNATKECEMIFKRYESDGVPCYKVEASVFGFDHADVGAELLGQWRIPGGLVEMVRNHHRPVMPHGAVSDDVIVHCADFIATALELGNSGELYVSPLYEEAAKACLTDEEQVVSSAPS